MKVQFACCWCTAAVMLMWEWWYMSFWESLAIDQFSHLDADITWIYVKYISCLKNDFQYLS